MFNNKDKKENQPEIEDKPVQDIKQPAEKEDFEKHIEGLREEGKKRKIFSYLGVVVILLFAAGAVTATYYYWPEIVSLFGLETNKKIACPADAKVCSDGTNVGRIPPDCEFAQCPVVEEEIDTSDWQTYQNEEHGFEVKYPEECKINLTSDSPISEKDNYFSFECVNKELDYITGIIYVNLAKSYITDRLNEPDTQVINEYKLSNGIKISQLYVKQYNISEKIILSYISKDDSIITLEIYGPQINSSEESFNYYKAFINSFQFLKTLGINTADWQTYQNEEMGVEFNYPNYFGQAKTEIIDYTDNSNRFANGKKVFVTFSDTRFHFEAYSNDYKAFKEFPFTGHRPIEEICLQELSYDDKGNVCQIEYFNNNIFILRNAFYADEGVFAFWREALLNNRPDSDYTGLKFSLFLGGINNAIEQYWLDEGGKAFEEARAQSENIIDQKNLSEEDLQLAQDFLMILESVKFIDSINTSNWQTYRNEVLGYEFKYPSVWTVDDATEPVLFKDASGKDIVSITSANRALLGISFCAANSRDARCEVVNSATVDWENATAEIDITGEVALFIALRQVSTSTKIIFKQILSTFKTITPIIPVPIILDSDNDGLLDDEEINYGTDPNNPDTDGDGHLDGDEVEGGYNPNGEGKL